MWPRALGDCATIEQTRLLSRFTELFKEVRLCPSTTTRGCHTYGSDALTAAQADTNGDGRLSMEEFAAMFEKNRKIYPQLDFYGKKMKELFEEADVNKDQTIDLDEFKALAAKVDSKLKMLPATAQVAAQVTNNSFFISLDLGVEQFKSHP